MGKALLVAASGTALASGDENNLCGYGSNTTAEANAQANCTEDATFSNLRASVLSGGSGTNTFKFRDAGADGNQVIAIVGASSLEDAVNTDVLSAGDLFNIAYTDTGSNSNICWIVGNVAFSSGHGSFHGCAAYSGAVHDVASDTRFIMLGGVLQVDAIAVEDNTKWKVRGYDSFEALQVRVTANARSNNSIFRNGIDADFGSGSITFATTETGLKTVTGLGDAITDGQTVNASITLDTGIEDLAVAFVLATFKSSSNKSETFASQSAGLVREASSTAHYTQIGGRLPGTITTFTEANARIKVGFAAVVSNLRCYLSANTYTANATLKLYQNGVAVITTTITAFGGAGWYENATDTITIDDDDELSFEFDEGTSGSITIHSAGITFSPVAGTGDGALASDGVGAMTAAGSSLASAAFLLTGSGTMTMTGAALVQAAMISQGEAIANLEGSAVAPGALQSTGEAAMVMEGASAAEAAGAFTMEGTSTVEWVGQSEATAAIAISGNNEMTMSGAALVQAEMLSQGEATANLEGAALAEGAFQMTGEGIMIMEGASAAQAAGAFAMEGSSTVEWIGQSEATAAMLSEGVGDASFVGEAGGAPEPEPAPSPVPEVGGGGAYGRPSYLKARRRKRLKQEDEELIAIIQQAAPYLMRARRTLH